MMTTRFRLLYVPLLFLASAMLPAVCSQAEEPPPKTIDLSKFKSSVDDVVIPVPSEIFNALDKLGGSLNWAGQIAPESRPKLVKQEDIAMLLGTVIANGFIAVQAKDEGKVQDIGRRVIELASALSVRGAVLKHCNAIIDASKLGDWTGVRTQLDQAQSSVGDAMKLLHSRDESELVSIAGWLRGTQTLTSLVSHEYKPERAELLHQPDLLTAFENQFSHMSENARNNHKVMELRKGLQQIKPLIDQPGNTDISQKSVEQINQITNSLMKSIAP